MRKIYYITEWYYTANIKKTGIIAAYDSKDKALGALGTIKNDFIKSLEISERADKIDKDFQSDSLVVEEGNNSITIRKEKVMHSFVNWSISEIEVW